MNTNTEVKQKIEQLLEPLLENDNFFIVDIKDENWLSNAMDRADKLCKEQFIPCEEAIQNYDEVISMKLLCKNIYGIKNG
jgi:hypothetical protein